ncbi:MAG: DUF2334 domain-containing protein [Tannerellaceae bacterium]|nr:DUF2334 domain-containing protein [Tannerellaceae bacterium]
MEIFKENEIETNIWVAPSHTFDQNTLSVLREYTSITIISDDIVLDPFEKYGFNWIPQ